MDTPLQFLLGAGFLFGLGLLGLAGWAIRSLAQANKSLADLAEKGILASRSSNSTELAAALNQRDQLKDDLKAVKTELQKQIGTDIASSPSYVIPSDPDVIEIAGIPLRTLRR